MKKISLVGLDQDLYFEKLENGLEVYLIPYKNKKNYSVHYATKFGSIQTEFIPVNEKKMIRVPDGIAHFLEHKMFEQEDGIDPFSFYSQTGTECNASTSWKSTRYLFEGTSNLKENLDYLLTYVNKPYFTDENVEKEKGIISEEIKMYDDDPSWTIERAMKEATFHLDNIKIDIAGTTSTINQITKEDLYHCYNTFYQPSNMFLIASGNINVEEMINIIKNNQALKERKSLLPFTEKQIKEPITVVKPYQEIYENVMNQKVGLTIKLPLPEKTMSKFQYDTYCGAILSCLFGSSSLLSEEIRQKELATSFYFTKELTNEYITFNFMAQSDKEKEFVKFIIDKLKNEPLKKEDLERLKKVWIASEVMMIDNISATLDNLYYDIVEFGSIIPNKLDIIRSLNIEQAKKIKKEFDLTNYSVVVAKPKEEK